MTPARLLTVAEVAEILRVSRAHVYSVKHQIGYVKFGRAVRFDGEAVQRFISSHARSEPERIGKISVRDL